MYSDISVDSVLEATVSDVSSVHPKKRKRLEKLTTPQLIAYQLRAQLINKCRVYCNILIAAEKRNILTSIYLGS